LISNWK